MSVRDEIKEQQKKLKGQGFKAHWDYFWEYYKIHTIVAIVVLIFVAITIRDVSNNKPYAMYSMFINNRGMDTQTILQDGFAEYAGINTEEYAIIVDTSSNFMSSIVDTTSVATSEKLMAMLAAHELDTLVADENTFGRYASQDTFIDLRTLYSENELESFGDKVFYVDQGYIDYLNSDEYTTYITSGEYDKNNKYAVMAAKYEEDFTYQKVAKEDMDDPIPVGIILDNSEALKSCEAFPDEAPIVGIAVNSQRIDNAKLFIEYLMK